MLVWAGDDEEPGEARVLFDANAGHYLPAEDLAGLGGQLAHRLAAAGVRGRTGRRTGAGAARTDEGTAIRTTGTFLVWHPP